MDLGEAACARILCPEIYLKMWFIKYHNTRDKVVERNSCSNVAARNFREITDSHARRSRVCTPANIFTLPGVTSIWTFWSICNIQQRVNFNWMRRLLTNCSYFSRNYIYFILDYKFKFIAAEKQSSIIYTYYYLLYVRVSITQISLIILGRKVTALFVCKWKTNFP